MAVQIPLPWLLTDVLCAMGLGFLYGGIYWLAALLLAPLAPGRARGTARRRRRRLVFFADALAALLAALFTRAWVLTASHAAQLRGVMALGTAAGVGAFFWGAAPTLQAVLVRARRTAAALLIPPWRLVCRTVRRCRLWALPRREHHRIAWEKRARRRQNRAAQHAAGRKEKKQEKNTKNTQENLPKELQKPVQIYYNSL